MLSGRFALQLQVLFYHNVIRTTLQLQLQLKSSRRGYRKNGWGCDEAALEASSALLASYMPEKWRDAVSWDGVERTCESLLGTMIHGYVSVSQDHYLDSAATCRASGTCDARHDPGSTLFRDWLN